MNNKLTHGVFTNDSIEVLRPFTSEAAAQKFASACGPHCYAAPIKWEDDDRYTAGGHFVEDK